ncbi:MAG: hypothetical protein HY735_07750 [Verrucomicrobia bacterium]|nr:hypothetical protein [Verrucomicrobiota bacterium]
MPAELRNLTSRGASPQRTAGGASENRTENASFCNSRGDEALTCKSEIRNPKPEVSQSLLTSAAAISQIGSEVAPGRFTLDGSDALEERLASLCARVRDGLKWIVPSDRLEAVLLGGGYGRGEGGVLRTADGDLPYNDLEFYVFVRGNSWLNERRWSDALRRAADEWSSEAGVHIELKILSLAKLRRCAVSMFYYDLLAGHRWVIGEEELLVGCEHHRSAERIPLSEATRLLMNRFTGVLFARDKLRRNEFTPEAHDFIVRNLAKAKLALGDAVLAAFGQYHWSCRERHRRLAQLLTKPQERRSFLPPHPGPLPRGEGESLAAVRPVEPERSFESRATPFPLPEGEGQGEEERDVRSSSGIGHPSDFSVGPATSLPWLDDILLHHWTGLDFKLHPRFTAESFQALGDQCAEVSALGCEIWLWLETKRLRKPFDGIRSYVLSGIDKCPETGRFRNRLVSAKLFGPQILFHPKSARYPRERLLNSLPLLLWEPAALGDSVLLSLIQTELGTRGTAYGELVRAYQTLWSRLNS